MSHNKPMKRAVTQKNHFDTAADNCVNVIETDGRKHDRTRRLYNKIASDGKTMSFSSRSKQGYRIRDDSLVERGSDISSLSSGSSRDRTAKLMGRMKHRRENAQKLKSAKSVASSKSTKCSQVIEEEEEEEAPKSPTSPTKRNDQHPQYPQYPYGYPPPMGHPGMPPPPGMMPGMPGYYMPPQMQMPMPMPMPMQPQMQMHPQMMQQPAGWGYPGQQPDMMQQPGLIQQQRMSQQLQQQQQQQGLEQQNLINQQQQEIIRQQQQQLQQKQQEQQDLLQKQQERLLKQQEESMQSLANAPPPAPPVRFPSPTQEQKDFMERTSNPLFNDGKPSLADQLKEQIDERASLSKTKEKSKPRSRRNSAERESSMSSTSGRNTDEFTVGILGFNDKSVLQQTISLLKKNSFSEKFNPEGSAGAAVANAVVPRAMHNSFREKTKDGLGRNSDRKVSQVLNKANRRIESRDSMELDFNDVYTVRKESFTPKSGLLSGKEAPNNAGSSRNFAFENPTFSH